LISVNALLACHINIGFAELTHASALLVVGCAIMLIVLIPRTPKLAACSY
jgi:hypothetical protein